MSGNFIEFDDLSNAIDNLAMALHFLKLDNPEQRWKWTIIAIHQALYGFAILVIRGTNPHPLTEDNRNKLISIGEALKRAKDDGFLTWSNSVSLKTTTDQDWAIKKLTQEFRNSFEHFKPGVWAIEISGMPQIITHVMDVICFLAFDSHSVMYQSLEQKTQTKELFDAIFERLDELRT